jgi:hypothetical protein
MEALDEIPKKNVDSKQRKPCIAFVDMLHRMPSPMQSMYASELTILCRQYPDISLRVEVRPESAEFEKLFGSSVANLQVSLPADYPNAGPSIDLSQLTAPQDGEEDGAEEELENRDEALLAVLVAKVHKELAAVVDESLGMPMLFTLINAFQVISDFKSKLDLLKK